MMEVEEQNLSSDSRSSIPGQHPRRPTAHESVSLLHSSGASQAHVRRPCSKPALDLTDLMLSRPSYPQRNSSGESSNAEKWFEKANHNVESRAAVLDDNDPPFFLRQSSSSDASPNMANSAWPLPQNASTSLPYRADFSNLFPSHSAESSSDEFRSVIDDLTIENKNLRRKLRKYEKVHDTHLQADKLFEIRIHGLPAGKKRELEETLQKFASSLEASPSSKQSGKTTKRFAAKLQTASSLANTDSAYASMSGQNQSLHSGQGNNVRPMPQPGMSQEQQQTIQSYLHEIPAGLFPQHQVVMTEKTKSKLVVRRMEQIFAGKGATDSGHHQPIQQQEVSDSAAHADRVVQGREGQEHDYEGVREARIVPISKHHGESKTTKLKGEENRDYLEIMDVDRIDVEEEGESNESPDQRPTRPLDLDPHRAQVPSDNIKYMRHLGFSPPEAGATANLTDDHGWVYLNVLTNMAQLHTINVTTDFVKRSISEYSDKLQLSPDGRKVRWRGGNTLTRTISDRSLLDGSRGSMAAPSNGGKSMHVSPSLPSDLPFKSAQSQLINQTANKLAYVPLFFRQEESDDSEGEKSAWTSPPRPDRESSALESSEMLMSSPRKRRGDDGPIIFYNKATFFTDLSGDNRGCNVDMGDVRHYSTNRLRPVGLPESVSTDEDRRIENEERGPLSRTGVLLETQAMDMDQSSDTTSDVVTAFSVPVLSRTSSSEEVLQATADFEVSGLGGVHPSDNFAINVKCRKRLAAEGSLPTIPERRNKLYIPRIQDILAETHPGPSSRQTQQRAVIDEIIDSVRRDLPASRLPDPSFYHFAADGDDSEDSDCDSDTDSSLSSISDASAIAHRAVPVSAPQLMNCPSIHAQDSSSGSESEDEEEDESMDGGDGEDDDDSGSIDMLAQARQLDIKSIRAMEREYDGNVADRLAEEIPAGASAGTAGGGSGYNSPQTSMNGKARDMKNSPILKRARVGALEKGRTKSPRVE